AARAAPRTDRDDVRRGRHLRTVTPMDRPREEVVRFSRLLLLAADVFPPLSATTRVEFAAGSRRLPSHAINEDHYLVSRFGRNQETLLTSLPAGVVPQYFDEYSYAMVVADGMGRAGEVASRLAIAALLELALRFGQWRVRAEDAAAHDIMERIESFYRQI